MENSFDYFKKHLAQTTEHPYTIEVAKAEGNYIYDTHGNKYLDLISGIAVSALGHANPKVKAAITKQLDTHLHTMVYGEFIQKPQIDLAQELQKTLPNFIDAFYFVNSGTEANEAALKLAKRINGRSQFIAFKGAYHGSTHGSMSVSWNEERKKAYRPLLPNVDFIALNDLRDLEKIDENTSAVILETIQGDAGVQIPEVDYMQVLRKRCNEVGALLILDEIQCGMGRTGKMWAFEHYGIIPDILTAGKALGAGMPIGCLMANNNLMQNFSHSPALGHITTFGGHPLACAAAAEGLRVMEEEQLIISIESKGALFEELLDHQSIVEIRRKGLMIAVELESDEMVNQLIDMAKENGLILFWFLSTPHAFRLAPPYSLDVEEIKSACSTLIDCLSKLTSFSK